MHYEIPSVNQQPMHKSSAHMALIFAAWRICLQENRVLEVLEDEN